MLDVLQLLKVHDPHVLEGPFLDIVATIDIEFLIMDERGVVTSPLRADLLESELAPEVIGG